MKSANIFCLVLLLLAIYFSSSVVAADKVVVIPLSSGARAAMPVAYGQVNGGASTSLGASYGDFTLSKIGTGYYLITLAKALTEVPVFVANALSSTHQDVIITYSTTSNRSIWIRTCDGSGTAQNSSFSFVVYGSYQ